MKNEEGQNGKPYIKQQICAVNYVADVKSRSVFFRMREKRGILYETKWQFVQKFAFYKTEKLRDQADFVLIYINTLIKF